MSEPSSTDEDTKIKIEHDEHVVMHKVDHW